MMQNKSYTISEDYAVFDQLFPTPFELEQELLSIQSKLHNPKNTSVFTKLNRLVKKYPSNANLLCDLGTYYAIRKNFEKAIETFNNIIDKNNNFTFAYVNLAQAYIDQRKFNDSARVLGEPMDIGNLMPDRKEFFIDEVKSYLQVCINHYYHKGDFDNAKIMLSKFEEIDADDELIETYRQMIYIFGGDDDFDDDYSDEDIESPELPEFQCNYISELFEFGHDIPQKLIETILKHDRQELIADLEKVLNYAREHNKFFVKKIRHEERNSFVLHAFLMLRELKAKESLETCVDFLTLNYDSLDYWFGDHKTETLWEVFYAFDIDLNYLKNYLIENYSKQYYFLNIADTVLCNTALLKPETVFQVSAIYKELLEFVDSLSVETDYIDAELNSMFISACLDLQLRNLLPLVEKLYSDGKVDELMCGTIDDVRDDFKYMLKASIPKLNSLREVYDYFESINSMFDDETDDDFDINDFFGDEPEDDDFFHGMTRTYPPMNESNQPKVNRNDPCPCGSGIKYKKCCLLDE